MRGGWLLVAGVMPTLAEGTAGIRLAGGTKRVTAAKPKALEPKDYGRAGSGDSRCCHEKAGRH